MLKVIVILHALRGNLIICGINSIWVSCTTTHVYYLLHVPSTGPTGNLNGPYLSPINIWVGFFKKPAPIFQSDYLLKG